MSTARKENGRGFTLSRHWSRPGSTCLRPFRTQGESGDSPCVKQSQLRNINGVEVLATLGEPDRCAIEEQ